MILKRLLGFGDSFRLCVTDWLQRARRFRPAGSGAGRDRRVCLGLSKVQVVGNPTVDHVRPGRQRQRHFDPGTFSTPFRKASLPVEFKVTGCPPARRLRSKLAAAVTHGAPQAERDAIKQGLNEVILARDIDKVVNTAPGITPAAAARLAAMLRPTVADTDDNTCVATTCAESGDDIE